MGTVDSMIVVGTTIVLVLTAMISGFITLKRFGETKGE